MIYQIREGELNSPVFEKRKFAKVTPQKSTPSVRRRKSSAIVSSPSRHSPIRRERTAGNSRILSYHDVIVNQEAVDTLLPNEWLNDVIISFYFQHLQSEVFEEHSEIYFVQPPIALAMKVLEDITAVAADIDFEKKSVILFPLTDSDSENSSTHWYLLVYFTKENRFEYYDSDYKPDSLQAHGIKEFCERILLHRNENSSASNIISARCAKQVGTYDCGVHLCYNAENVVQNFVQNKSKQQIPFPSTEDIANMREGLRSTIHNLASSIPDTANSVATTKPVVGEPREVSPCFDKFDRNTAQGKPIRRPRTTATLANTPILISQEEDPNEVGRSHDVAVATHNKIDPRPKVRAQPRNVTPGTINAPTIIDDESHTSGERGKKNGKKRPPKTNPFQTAQPKAFSKQRIVIQEKKTKSKKVQPIPSDSSDSDDDFNVPKRDKCKERYPPNMGMDSKKRRNRYTERQNCTPPKRQHRLKIGVSESRYAKTSVIAKTKNSMARLKGYVPRNNNKPSRPKGNGVNRQGCKYDKKTEQLFAIVMGLQSFIKAEKDKQSDNLVDTIKQQFADFAVEISKLSIDASYMIFHEYNRILAAEPRPLIIGRPDFRGFFASLKDSAKGDNCKNIRHLTSDYLDRRQTHHVNEGMLWSGAHKTNAIAMAADNYETSLKNSITENMYKRIKGFFEAAAPTIPAYSTLGYLFQKFSVMIPNRELLQLLQNELLIEDVTHYFHQLYVKWFSYIPVLYRLQQWRSSRGLKTFRIFPILKNKRHFVDYDSQALQQFLNSMNLAPSEWTSFAQREDEYWKDFFNLHKVESRNIANGIDCGHKFTKCISTDGVSVRVIMKRKKMPFADETEFMKQIAAKLDDDDIESIISFDPGGRLTMAGVRRMATNEETSIRYKSTSYRYDSGQYRLTRKYHRITNDILNKVRAERNKLVHKGSSMADPVEFINFQLEHFQELNDVLMQKSVAKLNFERYICKRRAIAHLARCLVFGKETVAAKKCKKKKSNNMTPPTPPADHQKSIIVFVGSTDISPIVKGYVKTPNRLIVKEMSQIPRVHIIKVNEHRTTMLCSRCHRPCVTAKSPHRWQFCTNFRVTWNRDVNAGRNIMYLGLARLRNEDPNCAFSYGFKFPKNAKGYRSVSEKAKPHTRRSTLRVRAEYRATTAGSITDLQSL